MFDGSEKGVFVSEKSASASVSKSIEKVGGVEPGGAVGLARLRERQAPLKKNSFCWFGQMRPFERQVASDRWAVDGTGVLRISEELV